eukprot:CAMPEP_0176345642 /NCGR_PEP_ID=MMETSP0126-20121128/5624_1 /TAXON_ID=141414 ORGANISM="Strombidinopsis acuminatum, Strain SPMC142" /NCGR_SAMPLE_ID=MMETSP0126 /ASSEMBLY_ACC=CAM_ASM_000229 /LENGTH=206 /DNA_ID=CAMNT_0017692747 /DNA_START=480 /DNA_END=1100 /DNA_ORIENTATION=+
MQDEESLYLLIEYLPGGELFKLMKKSLSLSEEDSRFYLAEIILAIESLHKKNIIYRDLKPENVLIDKDGHVKLIDFGFSKIMKDITRDRAMTNCGTPQYAAPEVMLGIGYNYKADIWSIGILICEMIGGFTPFNGMDISDSPGIKSNPKVLLEQMRSHQINLPKNLNKVARDLVKYILNSEPSLRPEIADIKAHKFFRGVDWNSVG